MRYIRHVRHIRDIRPARRRSTAFALIELMAVLAIVCILAALAYPSLHRYIVLGKRAQAQAALLQLMQQQERYFSLNNSYLAFSSNSTDPAEKLFKWWSGASAAESAYEIEGVACPGEAIAQCVQLNARPGTAKVDRVYRDLDCGILSLSSAGERSVSGVAPRCWP
ncbi:MAG TPA: pilus assembly protein PilE [Janthinobacterium sp.]|nr:pilus assembly protein PilE [Janthinobacterium sp.]